MLATVCTNAQVWNVRERGRVMRRTILWVTEAREFIVVGFVVIVAFMLWVAATAPPTTMSANAASAQYIDYFALGDS